MSRIGQMESGSSLIEVEATESDITVASAGSCAMTSGADALRQNSFQANRRRVVMALVLIIALYASLAFAMSAAKAPWMDEGWISIPAWNLAFHGKTGNPVMEPTGFWLGNNLPGIHEIDYLNMPLYTPVQAVWFRIFGFSVLSMHSLSILFGGIALLAWFAIVESFAGVYTALLAAGLMAIDVTYLSNATDGRMDMMCMCCWAIGIALYLQLRQKSLKRALLWANVFVAASAFTHPNGAVGFILLVSLVAVLDRRHLRWSYLLQCWPYVAGLAGWLAYISLRPAYFLAQFGANSGGDSGRLNLIPWEAIWSEVIIRYLSYFSGNATWGRPVPPQALFIIFCYWAAFLAVAITAVRHRHSVARYAAGIAGVLAAALTFLVGFKPPYYLIHVIPAYAACMAVWATGLSRRRGFAVIFMGVLIIFQAFAIRVHLRSGNASDYKATVDFIKGHVDPKARLLAGSYFFLDLRDYNISDDLKLGYWTHRDPDYIVLDRGYKSIWEGPFIGHPGIWLHIQRLMTSTKVHRMFAKGEYVVYSVD